MPDSSQPRFKPPRRRSRNQRAPSLVLVETYKTADWQRVVDNLKDSWSGAAISLTLHAIVLLGLTFFAVYTPVEEFEPLELGWSTVVNRQQEPETVSVIEPITLPVVSTNDKASLPKVPEKNTPDENERSESNDEVQLADVSAALKLRAATREHGQSPQQAGIGRQAIEDALDWIVRQQQADGSWQLTGPYPDAGTVETQTGATSLALLALLGDGQTHRHGRFQSQVEAGLRWLVNVQHADGDLFDIEEEGREAHFYAHAMGTIVLCEALALTGDEALRQPAQMAVQFLADAQNPVLGGWKYRPLNADGIGDLSVTGWALMALHSARIAQLEIDEQAFQIARQFLNAVQEEASNRAYYKYRPDFPIEEAQRHSMTAEGLLCRQWLGWPKHEPALKRGIAFLLAMQNQPEWKPYRRNVYAWYYTAQTLHNLGGADWENWFAQILPMLVEQQQQSGKLRGSWHPTKPPGAFQERSQDAGRLYVTVMCVLILETPYRHAPLYGLRE